MGFRLLVEAVWAVEPLYCYLCGRTVVFQWCPDARVRHPSDRNLDNRVNWVRPHGGGHVYCKWQEQRVLDLLYWESLARPGTCCAFIPVSGQDYWHYGVYLAVLVCTTYESRSSVDGFCCNAVYGSVLRKEYYQRRLLRYDFKSG